MLCISSVLRKSPWKRQRELRCQLAFGLVWMLIAYGFISTAPASQGFRVSSLICWDQSLIFICRSCSINVYLEKLGAFVGVPLQYKKVLKMWKDLIYTIMPASGQSLEESSNASCNCKVGFGDGWTICRKGTLLYWGWRLFFQQKEKRKLLLRWHEVSLCGFLLYP